MCHPSWTRALTEAQYLRDLERLHRMAAGPSVSAPVRDLQAADGQSPNDHLLSRRVVTPSAGIFRCRYQEK